MGLGQIFGFLPHFIYSQLFITPPVPRTDCTGKTVIVTGSNTGLGREAVRHYVRLNAERVVLACRSSEKGEAAKNDIEASTQRRGVVEVWPLDLSDYQSVKAFAARASELKRLDMVILNAGINTNRFVNMAGNESSITVNVVSTFLLGLLLLPKLRESGHHFNMTPTVTVVSSEVHHFTEFSERHSPVIFDRLNDPETARMRERYLVSKLIEVLVCREIAREHPIERMRVTLNFVNPGLCQTELTREVAEKPSSMVIAFLKMITRYLSRTSEVGARTLVHAGLCGPETHGKYLSDCRVEPCAPLVEGEEGPEIQRRVWQELFEKLKDIEPKVTEIME